MNKLYKKFQSYQSLQSSKDDDKEALQLNSNTESHSSASLPATDNKWTKTRIRNWISHILTIISLIIFIPGIWYPMLDVRIYLNVPGAQILLEVQRRGVITTISYLLKCGGYFPGILIIIFSIAIPLAKAALLLLMNFVHNRKYHYFVYTLIRDWGKWSMSDIFVTVIFLSFFASLLVADIKAKILPGFYCFLAYCIISLAATQVMCPPTHPDENPEKETIKNADTNNRIPLTSSDAPGDGKNIQDMDRTAMAHDSVVDCDKVNP